MTQDNPSPFLADDTTDPYPKIYRAKKRRGFFGRAAHATKNVFARGASSEPIPVTIFTGYLGAGKTTVITNLMNALPDGYKIAWLKNEIGNTAVDTELANATRITTTKEMLQGCICHVMIGQLSDALEDMIATAPDRIIIETSGSATPAPVVFEIRKDPRLRVDGVVTVVDALNFHGYVDKSPTLKLQARYTDLILINKHEELSEQALDQNLDDLYDINLDTPKIFTRRGAVSPDLVFGLDSTLLKTKDRTSLDDAAHDHQAMEVELVECTPTATLEINQFVANLKKFPGKQFYRIKGVVSTTSGPQIVNCAFGTCTLTPLAKSAAAKPRIVMMGEDLLDHRVHILKTFHVAEEDLRHTPRHGHVDLTSQSR